MAVVQYSAIVTQLRGKLGGSVFNKSKNAYTLQKKQQQPKGSRGYQSEVRNFFAKFQRTWKTITSSQRTQWGVCASNNPTRDRFGNQTVLSGYNQYVKANMLAEYCNTVAPATPYTSPAPPFAVSVIGLGQVVFSISSTGVPQISANPTFDFDTTDSAYGVIMDISLPVSMGVTAYHGRFTNVFGRLADTYSPPPFVEYLGSSYPLPQTGQLMFIRSRVVHIASGAVVYEDIDRLFFTVS